MTGWNRILVPTDFSDTSMAAVRQGVDLARNSGAELLLLYVIPEVATEFPIELDAQVLEAERDRVLALLAPSVRTAVRADVVVCQGAPAQEIVRCAEERDVDVIVMGTHGRGGVSHLILGSVAEQVIRMAPCPVLVVRNTATPAGVAAEVAPSAVGAVLQA